MPSFRFAPLVLGLVLFPMPGRAAEPVDYLRQIKPLLAARCYACHASLQQKGDFRVDTVKLLREGGGKGPAMVPGASGESLLIVRVQGTRAGPRMPPTSEGEGLSEKDIALLKLWIDQGANGPADEKPEPDPREHWAFHTPVRPPVPAVKDLGPKPNPIDAFLGLEMEKRGLKPQPPADKRLLLRRLYLDLVGLPPTREELAAFEIDSSPDAYEKVVDRLLASKQYGERWGRHWMDVWRYSDWWGLGAEVRNSQKHVWHWRDWIIESLNADKGYDQMVREMLAADELYPNDLDRLRATGFLVRPYFLFNRNSWLDETVEHTGKAFLGLTLNCSRCHDHKYDPISQQDYFRFRAFFEPYQVRTDQVPGESDYARDGLPRVFDCNLETPTYRFERGDEKRPLKDRPLAPGLPALLTFAPLKIQPVTLPAEAQNPGLRAFVLENHLKLAEQRITLARTALDQARKTLAEREKNAPKDPVPVVSPTTGDEKPPIDKTNLMPKVLFRDDFAGPKPELWEAGPGKWRHQGGKLLQEFEGEMRSSLKARTQPPEDFQARFKLAITGGEPWRSVGIAFDVAGAKEAMVYVSAYASGPKLQIYYKQAGKDVYPPEAAQNRPIKLNEPLEMTVRIRGALVNVAINDKHALAYRLPIPRQKGSLQLITYAAKAEFLAFELSTLPTEVKMLEPSNQPSVPNTSPLTVEQARAALIVAEKGLATAETEPALWKARSAADRARVQQPPSADAAALGRAAALLERQFSVAQAEENLARTELAVVRAAVSARPGEEVKRTAARTALDQARKSMQAPGETYTSLKGSLKSPENNLETEVSRGKPYPATSTGRRSALAQWLTDVRHPLTARVAVNHLWLRHFGKPLAPNVFDFGRKGAPPTHPALLDFLAVELMENRWSLKHLHRLMVTSNAYRRSSATAGSPVVNVETDRENRWYWRMNPVRMEAQVIRDSMLSLAGDLDLTMGGPPLDPVNLAESPRRSLYFFHSHNEHHKFLAQFDDASVLECYRRSESIVPQQALTMSNSQFALRMADRIEARMQERLGAIPDTTFARLAFETILAGKPTPAEQAACEQALADLTKLLQEQKVPNANVRARQGLIQALLNHNDFVTIR
jgi:Protein of unknown function (DUF1549)/Protein of unknown function (DUF1553)/Planctomycete cytochrome C